MYPAPISAFKAGYDDANRLYVHQMSKSSFIEPQGKKFSLPSRICSFIPVINIIMLLWEVKKLNDEIRSFKNDEESTYSEKVDNYIKADNLLIKGAVGLRKTFVINTFGEIFANSFTLGILMATATPITLPIVAGMIVASLALSISKIVISHFCIAPSRKHVEQLLIDINPKV